MDKLKHGLAFIGKRVRVSGSPHQHNEGNDVYSEKYIKVAATTPHLCDATRHWSSNYSC
jgi:hypothetical protein